MQREILFKAKRIDNGEWVFGSLVTLDSYAYIIDRDLISWSDNGESPEFDLVQVNPDTICQYTGINDKNGNKIFEWDKLKTRNKDDWGYVVWNAPFFELTVSEDQSSLYTREFLSDSEIIGNFHD